METNNQYAARLEVDYPEKLNRLSSFFRPIWIIPIAILIGLIAGAGETVNNTVVNDPLSAALSSLVV